MRAQEVLKMIEEVDSNFNGQIEFEEFVLLMGKNMSGEDDGNALVEAFSILDTDGSGHIERKELQDLLRSFSKLGEDIPDDEIDHLIRECDVECVRAPIATPPHLRLRCRSDSLTL